MFVGMCVLLYDVSLSNFAVKIKTANVHTALLIVYKVFVWVSAFAGTPYASDSKKTCNAFGTILIIHERQRDGTRSFVEF